MIIIRKGHNQPDSFINTRQGCSSDTFSIIYGSSIFKRSTAGEKIHSWKKEPQPEKRSIGGQKVHGRTKRSMAGQKIRSRKNERDDRWTNNLQYIDFIHSLVVRGGRIGVTQGRDEDAPTMTPKNIAIASRALQPENNLICYCLRSTVQEFQKPSAPSKSQKVCIAGKAYKVCSRKQPKSRKNNLNLCTSTPMLLDESPALDNEINPVRRDPYNPYKSQKSI